MTCQFWRVAITEGGLGFNTFVNLGLPQPSAFTYQDYKDSRMRSNGQLTIFGRPQLTVLFDILDSKQGWKVRNIVGDALNNGGFIFMTIPRTDASNVGYDWIDVTGIPHRPLVAGAGTYTGRKGDVFYNNYQLTVEDVSIVNDPSVHTF